MPPVNVGVAPTVGPFVPCWTVTLCISGAMLVNRIATFPGVAVNEVRVYFSCPLGSAARVSSFPAWATGAAEELEAAEALEVEAGAEADAEWGLVLLDPPHAASPSIDTTEVSERARNLDTERPFNRGQNEPAGCTCRVLKPNSKDRTPEKAESFPE